MDLFAKAELMFECEQQLKNITNVARRSLEIDPEAGPSRIQEALYQSVIEASLERSKDTTNDYSQKRGSPEAFSGSRDVEPPRFDLSMKYDLSYIPTDDPNVYKPLEIISYIGIMKP